MDVTLAFLFGAMLTGLIHLVLGWVAALEALARGRMQARRRAQARLLDAGFCLGIALLVSVLAR